MTQHSINHCDGQVQFRSEGKEGSAGRAGGSVGLCWGSMVLCWGSVDRRTRLRAELVARAVGQRWPGMDGGCKHLLRAPRLRLVLLALCVGEDSFHSSVLKKKGAGGSRTCCCREAGAELRAGQRSGRASAVPSRAGLPPCFCREFSQLWVLQTEGFMSEL